MSMLSGNCVEGGWTLQKEDDMGWSDKKTCQDGQNEERLEKHKANHCPTWREASSGTNPSGNINPKP